jgi:endonuclease YncB( thermonuclease family)
MRFDRRALLASALFVFWLPLALAKTPAGAPTETVRVDQALDGDSLRLADGRQVRLIGVNTPEIQPSADKGKHVAPQPLAREAARFTGARVNGQTVTLHFKAERTDRYQRLLAHVTLADGTHLEEALLRAGLGWMVAIPPNVEELPRLQAAEDEARRAKRGVWGRSEYQPVAAEQLTTKDGGFLLVSGTVRGLRQSSYAYYFELAPRASLLVPREEWNRYFAGRYASPQALVGRKLTARGWASARDGKLRVRVAHPAMLTFSEP